ncbi:hypothetical protein HPB47_006126 [Ixodes persulcatus]|uniref:Uncharacterized protein n=1 Tax=Ixodes persulcatus TaxID=34615 RepID=A0AC60PB43_IXOPE|nr:hypothetical protein HPB47_006126 [Ixodes persulcatus]
MSAPPGEGPSARRTGRRWQHPTPQREEGTRGGQEKSGVERERLVLKDSTALYSFGKRSFAVATAMGGCVSDLVIDGVKGSNIDVLVVPDDAQAAEHIVGRTFTDLPHLAYA